MAKCYVALPVVALGCLSLSVLLLSAQESQKSDSDQRAQRLKAMTEKLGLNDQQQQQFRKLHADFHQKAQPLEQQLWRLHHEEHEAMEQVLTADQRAKLPEVLHAQWDQQWQTMSSKLHLNAEQKQHIDRIRNEYAQKFRDLFQQKGEKSPQQFHQLRMQFFSEVSRELNAEQRAQLPMLLHEAFRQWREPTARSEKLKTIADQLGLSQEQRDRVEKIHRDYQPRCEKLVSQLKELRQTEHAQMEQVLTPDQRTKFETLIKPVSDEGK